MYFSSVNSILCQDRILILKTKTRFCIYFNFFILYLHIFWVVLIAIFKKLRTIYNWVVEGMDQTSTRQIYCYGFPSARLVNLLLPHGTLASNGLRRRHMVEYSSTSGPIRLSSPKQSFHKPGTCFPQKSHLLIMCLCSSQNTFAKNLPWSSCVCACMNACQCVGVV